ncbi:MAG: hypothetical protein ABIZ80_13620, partial [Bryobacteraceae bacterium]
MSPRTPVTAQAILTSNDWVPPSMMLRSSLVTSLFFLAVSSRIVPAQSTSLLCSASSVPALIHAEGIAEPVGDIVLGCSGGTPGTLVTGNLTVFLSVNITNRLSPSGTVDTLLTVDNGSGPLSFGSPALLVSNNSISFNGLSFTVPPSGTVNLRITNLRGAVATQSAGLGRPILASLGFNGSSTVTINNSQFVVGIANTGLLASYSSAGIRCTGSALPATINFANLLATPTRFFSTRFTEGFAASFEKRFGGADSATRLMARYVGFPSGARLFVPDVIAGSSSLQPTAGGDLGLPPSGGQYQPGFGGSLLLVRVSGTDAAGAGGSLAVNPASLPSGANAFNAVSEVPLSGGAGVAVYEVVDSNASLLESAQFPTFIGLAQITDGTATVAYEKVSFAPISPLVTASSSAPIPRYTDAVPGSDCPVLQDCSASYFPQMTLSLAQPLNFTAAAGRFDTKYVQVRNPSGGLLNWTASVTYRTGAGWLSLDPSSGLNNGTIRIDASPAKLTPGTYEANLTVDGGPLLGSKTVSISFIVTSAPITTPPVTTPPTTTPSLSVRSLSNAALPEYSSVAPGSLARVRGSGLAGTNVSVSLDGVPATILSKADDRIDVVIPIAVGARRGAALQVSVDGRLSPPMAVNIAELAPGVFPNGILNQDGSVNSDS